MEKQQFCDSGETSGVKLEWLLLHRWDSLASGHYRAFSIIKLTTNKIQEIQGMVRPLRPNKQLQSQDVVAPVNFGTKFTEQAHVSTNQWCSISYDCFILKLSPTMIYPCFWLKPPPKSNRSHRFKLSASNAYMVHYIKHSDNSSEP